MTSVRKKKILILGNSHLVVFKFRGELISTLVERGYDVWVCFNGPFGEGEQAAKIYGYLNMTSHLEEHLDNFEFDIQLVKSLVQKIEVSADKRIRIVFGFQDVFTELGKESAET